MTLFLPMTARVFGSGPLWISSAIAIAAVVLAVWLDHRPTSKRFVLAIAAACAGVSCLFGLYVIIGVDCGSLPEWLCFLF